MCPLLVCLRAPVQRASMQKSEKKAPAEEEEEDYEEEEEDEEEEAEEDDASSDDYDEGNTAKRKSPSAPSKTKKPAAAPKKSRTNTAPLDRLLAPLDAESLSKLLIEVCARPMADQATVSNEQFVRQRIGGGVSLAAVDSKLADARACFKKIGPAFPNTRYGSDTDHYCYKRVRPVQAVFIKKVAEPLVDLKAAKDNAALLRYLRGALPLAFDLPTWDQAADNKPRIALFKRLAAALRIALRSPEGKADDRSKWKALLEDAPPEFAECIKLLNK